MERYEELANRGITKFPNKLSVEQIKTQKAALEKTLGNKLPSVKASLEQLRGYSNRLLTEARDAGIVSKEAFETIVKNNEKYIPLQRLEYLADQMDNLPRGSNSFNVSTQNLIKRIKGSEKEALSSTHS